jgi:hypothetical protein
MALPRLPTTNYTTPKPLQFLHKTLWYKSTQEKLIYVYTESYTSEKNIENYNRTIEGEEKN